METSLSDMVEVRAASDTSTKNNDDHSPPQLHLCEKIGQGDKDKLGSLRRTDAECEYRRENDDAGEYGYEGVERRDGCGNPRKMRFF